MSRRLQSGFDWRDRLVQSVETSALERKKGKRRSHHDHRLNLEVPNGLWPLLIEAARRRGGSPTAYIRRATIAFIAHDLNKRIEDVFALDPRWSTPGSRRPIDDPAGERGGSWDIEDLR